MSSKFINIGHIQFESKHVLEALMNLDIKKGIGPDKVSPILLQECADSLSRSLTYIFNKSLKIGLFPKRWSPILKSGSRRCVDNYQGVAILPTMAKLFELLVSKIHTYLLHILRKKCS